MRGVGLPDDAFLSLLKDRVKKGIVTVTRANSDGFASWIEYSPASGKALVKKKCSSYLADEVAKLIR